MLILIELIKDFVYIFDICCLNVFDLFFDNVVCDLFLFLLLGEIDRLGRYSMVKVFEGMLDWVY